MSTEDKNIQLVKYLEGELSPEESANLESTLKHDPDLKKEFQELKELFGLLGNQEEYLPDAALKMEFLEILENEKARLTETTPIRNIQKQGFPQWFSVAATVSLLLIGTFTANWIKHSTDQQNEIKALKEEVSITRKLLLLAISDQQASTRLEAVNSVNKIEMDDELVISMIRVVKDDSNLNVKLAALEALKPMTSDYRVNDAFLKLVAERDEPLLQIYLIQMLSEMEDEKSIAAIQALLVDENTAELVREEAQLALFRINKTMI